MSVEALAAVLHHSRAKGTADGALEWAIRMRLLTEAGYL